ncbi:MAG: CDP-glycerol glycerophosphotransferase family protein, partial [Spirochaetia bacterium]|nr:CDP-glycerol glycerophosphotransferase family protein [Spirochaetia bacterium]
MLVLIKEYIKFFIRALLWFFLHVFYLCPIDEKKIYFRAFHGKRYGCSPKYLFLYIKEKFGDSYKYIWELKNNIQEIPSAKCVKRLSVKSFIHMMTSRHIITNNDFMWWIPLRKDQIVVETWHGGGAYKRIGKYERGLPLFHTEQELNARQVSYYVSSCRRYTEALSDSKYVSPDRFIPTGLPRNEVFFCPERMSELKNKVFAHFGLPAAPDTHIVLFAPTYRGIRGYKEGNVEISLEPDYNKLLSALLEKFGGSWKLFYRSHYFDSQLLKALPDRVINATKYEDMQELLCAADVLVTDFSSSMWDFALAGKPCFLYAPDIQQYIDNRGFYTDPSTWPYPLA